MDNTHQVRGKKHLTTTEKWAVVADYILYLDQERMRLIDGARKIIEEEFHVVGDHSTRLINRYWTQRSEGVVFPNLDRVLEKSMGPKLFLDEALAECIREYHRLEGCNLSTSSVCFWSSMRYTRLIFLSQACTIT